jgi:hypothetical protein
MPIGKFFVANSALAAVLAAAVLAVVVGGKG